MTAKEDRLMARIRSLKPEFWDDRKLARATSRDARMLYMALWNQADEHSRVNGDVVWLKGRVFPYDDDISTDDIAKLLLQLEAARRIEQYEVDGDPFIFLPKLEQHQRLEPKVVSRLPAPPFQDRKSQPLSSDTQECEISTDTQESARDVPYSPDAEKSASDAEKNTLLYVAGSREQVAGSRGQGRARGANTPTRGTRLPPDWMPGLDLIEAMRAHGVPDAIAQRELLKFRDYWAGAPGAKGVKADWPATWRNWIRRTLEEEQRRGPPAAHSATDKANSWAALEE